MHNPFNATKRKQRLELQKLTNSILDLGGYIKTDGKNQYEPMLFHADNRFAHTLPDNFRQIHAVEYSQIFHCFFGYNVIEEKEYEHKLKKLLTGG